MSHYELWQTETSYSDAPAQSRPESTTVDIAATGGPPGHGSTVRWVVAGLVAVCVALAAVVVAVWIARPAPRPSARSSGVSCDTDGECTGVTASDGAKFVAGDAQWKAVADKIAAENKAVDSRAVGSVHVVTMAYLLSVPFGDGALGEIPGMRHELEGAYIAQLRANHDQSLGRTPLVRVLVASNGNKAHQWKAVADELVEATGDATHPLVAVVGLGQSRDETMQTIDQLNTHRIPMVASVISADDLTDRPGERLNAIVRVGPTNSGEGTALGNYLAQSKVTDPMLIWDTNRADQYVSSLAAALRTSYPNLPEKNIEGYDASLPDIGNAFTNMLAKVCQLDPDTIYFAGRSTELAEFIDALPARPCQQKPMTILSGDSASGLVNRLSGQPDSEAFIRGLNSGVTLRYVTMAHPQEWDNPSTAFAAISVDYFRAGPNCGEYCFLSQFPGEDLADGQAIMAHDAFLVATRATRMTNWQDNADKYRGAVIQQWNSLNGPNAVAGASGWISLDGHGVPQRKAVPILELRADGAHFVTLTSSASSSSPDDTPFTPS